jgi:hypothetical protein
MVTGVLFLLLATSASAATINGTATITTPTNGSIASSQPQPSDTIFALSLPAGATCSGSTTSGGYQVYTYLIPKGSNIQNSTVSQGSLSSYGLFDSTGTLVGPFNVPTNDIVSTLPNDLEWGPAVTGDSFLAALLAAPGVWEAGVACANASGAVTDYWDVDITFTSVPTTTDPDGFEWAWSASSGTTSPTTTTSTSTSTTAPNGSTSTTTASGSATTTTTATGGSASPSSAGSGGATGTSSGVASTGSDGSGTTGALAFTGMPASVVKILGAGLLGIGCGLMLLGSAGGSRDKRSRPLRDSLR